MFFEADGEEDENITSENLTWGVHLGTLEKMVEDIDPITLVNC